MNEHLVRAKEKLATECESKMDRYEEIMKKDVKAALENFCEQDDEFAQAVVQGGSFVDCMKAVSKKIKNNCISDMEAYGEAVRFYFPGAEIKVQMKIDLIGEADDTQEKRGVIVDLTSYF